MDNVYLSAFDVLNERYEEIIYSMKNNRVVFGSTDDRQRL